MIVPRSRLLVWVTVLVLPFAAIAGMASEFTLLAVGLIILFFLIVFADAVVAQERLGGVKVELPEVTRLSKDREGLIELQIRNEQQKQRELRLGLELPLELHSDREDVIALLPASSDLSRINWKCTPLKRGSYLIEKCYLEGASPMGFWSVRTTAPARGEIRVYPNLMTERKNVAALFLNRGSFGTHAHRQIGKGRDFEKLRDYVPGDSYDEIHWKGTAKRGRPVTKIFQVERTQEIYVIIDASRLSGRLVQGPKTEGRAANLVDENQKEEEAKVGSVSILERYITAALVLGVAAEQQGDLFGLLTFTDKVQKFVRAKNGKAHYSACRDALYTLHPQTVTPDFDELCSFIRLRLRRRALLVFLTAMDDPLLAESFIRNMDLICRQHLIVVNMMQPPGAKPIFSDPNVASLDDVYQQLGGHVLWHNLRELDKTLQRRGVRFSLLDNEKLSAQLVTQYLTIKRRQLL